MIQQSLLTLFMGSQSILEACMADMEAAKERDPACDKYTQCILYFKGFQAIQCQRIAHWLWKKDRKVAAHMMASLACSPFNALMLHPYCFWVMLDTHAATCDVAYDATALNHHSLYVAACRCWQLRCKVEYQRCCMWTFTLQLSWGLAYSLIMPLEL